MQNDQRKDREPDHYTLVDKTGRKLRLEKTTDSKGVVFYEASLDWRVPKVANDK